MRHNMAVTAIAVGILIALAIGCVRKVAKDREWKNGQWQYKEERQ